MTPSAELHALFGEIDIYLFDQLLRGRFDARRRILDAGCGTGRNLPYLLARGFEVHAVDGDASAIRALQRLEPPVAEARVAELSNLPWAAERFDAVICSAVLHFARDEGHFEAMVRELWRVLRPGGLFFARLATSIGIAHLLPAPTGRVRLPDGSERFVVDEAAILSLTGSLGGVLLDPLKTTNVQNQRAMSTWVAEKRG